MPTYRITTPDGRTLRVTGDSPPSEQELEQLYESFQASQPSIPEEPSAMSRFVEPFKEAGRGIGQLVEAVGQKPGFGSPEEIAAIIPGGAATYKLGTGLVGAQLEQLKKAYEAQQEGRGTEALGHTAAGILPMAGPMAANIGEALGEGNVAGAAGQATLAAAPFMLGKAGRGVAATGRAVSRGAAGAGGALDTLTAFAEHPLAELIPGSGKIRLARHGIKAGAPLINFLLRLKSEAPSVPAFATGTGSMAPPAMIPSVSFSTPAAAAAAEAAAARAAAARAFAASTGTTAPQAVIPSVSFSAPAAAAARLPSSVVPFAAPAAAAPAVAAPIAAAAPAVGRAGSQFQLGSAELARMLGQTEAAAAPAAAPILTATAPEVAPVVAAAAPAAAPAAATTGLGLTIRPGYEISHMAERLRHIADTSAANKAAIMQGIKQDYAAFGFPTWQKMRDFVFQPKMSIPSAQAVAEAEAAAALPGAPRPKLAYTVQPGSERSYITERLRDLAETSGKDRAAILELIKQRYAEFGFPTSQAMLRFVFKGER